MACEPPRVLRGSRALGGGDGCGPGECSVNNSLMFILFNINKYTISLFSFFLHN